MKSLYILTCWLWFHMSIVFCDSQVKVVVHNNGSCELKWMMSERVVTSFRRFGRIKYRTEIHEIPRSIFHCCSGYTLKEGFTDAQYGPCVPVCYPPCINSNCTSPGNCECLKGFSRRTSANVCDPECSPACVNSHCSTDDVCVCNVGFIPTEEPSVCGPYCPYGCQNGHCTTPETCTCLENYTLSATNGSICDPICSLECINGLCSAPDECACEKGYQKSADWNICSPYCSKACVNGDCTLPEVCTCWNGFVKRPEDPSYCWPVCSNGCVNGDCVEPEVCQCKDGYVMLNSAECIPFCPEGCINGNCSAPGACTCDEGYVLQNGTCTPYCSSDCVNGECVAPDVCLCESGYTAHNDSTCVPVCSDGCVNGQCSAPEVCTCSDGYVLEEGNCLPFCASDCINGNCTALNECTCDLGALKTNVFHCVKTCRDFPSDEDCLYYSESSIEQYLLIADSDNSSVQIEFKATSLSAPCSSSLSPFMTRKVECFTEIVEESEMVRSVCSSAITQPENGTQQLPNGRGLNGTTEVRQLILVFLRAKEEHLCPASLCADTNSTLLLNGVAELTLCFRDSIEDEKRQRGSTSPLWVISAWIAVVLVVIAAAVGYFLYKRGRKISYATNETYLLSEETRSVSTLQDDNQGQESSIDNVPSNETVELI